MIKLISALVFYMKNIFKSTRDSIASATSIKVHKARNKDLMNRHHKLSFIESKKITKYKPYKDISGSANDIKAPYGPQDSRYHVEIKYFPATSQEDDIHSISATLRYIF